jgi:DnaJ-class molecular chaperone
MANQTCSACGGSGEVACQGCGGSGSPREDKDRIDEAREWASCSSCHGRGTITCRKCGGSGTV